MKYRQCPEGIQPGDTNTLFLAGGITGCPDWQMAMVKLLKDTSLTLINPRRLDFDVENPDMEYEQIVWEHQNLEASDMISFWFPKETLCPITLFELGKYLKSNKKLFIGIESEYQRSRDIEIQSTLLRPGIVFHSSIESLVGEIKSYSESLL